MDPVTIMLSETDPIVQQFMLTQYGIIVVLGVLLLWQVFFARRH